MRRTRRTIRKPNPFTVWIGGILSLFTVIPPQSWSEPDSQSTEIATFVGAYCTDCHGNEKSKAEVNLEAALATGLPRIEDIVLWEDVIDLVETGEMPPDKKPQPEPEERESFVSLLATTLEDFSCSGPVNPGRVTVRRLNRIEYTNTIRDLLGVDFKATEAFPTDEVGYGFDNIGDVLTLSPVLMEKYLDAAATIAESAVLREIPPWPPEQKFEGESMKIVEGGDHIRIARDRYLGFYREGRAEHVFSTDTPGRYHIEILAQEDAAGPEHSKLGVKLNGTDVKEFTVDRKKRYRVETKLKNGTHKLEFSYLNNFNKEGDRNLYVDYAVIRGPLGEPRPPLPDSHTRVIPSPPPPGKEIEHARKLLSDLTRRAFRRPSQSDEVERLLDIVNTVIDDGGSFNESMSVALQAVLVSPHFLFRWELDDKSKDDASDPGPRPVNAYELASRLSYFLWSSMPDDTLLTLADNGTLLRQKVLTQQLDRMLKDKKSTALIENFAGQWLQTRNLQTHQPDPDLFAEFDDELRVSMQRETELFVSELVRKNRSITDFLTADFTFLNERLARHYGIPGVKGRSFQKVSLPADSNRRGVLTQGSVLTLTSFPTRTSPVVRGKWILEQILGTPPPPPPPNVELLDESPQATQSAPLRERLELHRAKPDCLGCHKKMDPLGFALEHFDAIGRWRDRDANQEIDSSAKLSSGEEVGGAADLALALAGKQDFARNFTEKMMTYALGRGLEYYDRCVVDTIVEDLTANDYRISYLLKSIVLSEPFLKRNLPEKPDHE